MNENKIGPLLILPVIWGSYYVASQRLVGYTSVFTAGIGIRFLTMVFLTAGMWKRRELGKLFSVRGTVKRLILIGTLGFLLDWTAFLGLSMSSAAGGTALLKCDVLMVNLLSMLIERQKFTWKIWGCTLVMLFGVFLVMGMEIGDFQARDPGNIFFLLSAFFVSLNAFVIKSVQQDSCNPLGDSVVAYYNNLITMGYFIAASLFMETADETVRIFAGWKSLSALLLAAVGQTLIYIVYYHNLRTYPVWLVKTFLLLMPLVSAGISFVLFQERLSSEQYFGIAVVIAGALGILAEQKSIEKNQKCGENI